MYSNALSSCGWGVRCVRLLFVLLLIPHIHCDESECHHKQEVLDPKNLRRTKLVFAALEVELDKTGSNLNRTHVLLVNENGTFRSEELDRSIKVNEDGVSGMRLFLTAPDTVYLFYYNKEASQAMSAYRYVVTSTKSNEYALKKEEVKVYHLQGRLRYLGQTDKSFISYEKRCFDVLAERETIVKPWNELKMVSSLGSGVFDVSICAEKNVYCLTDLGLRTIHAYYAQLEPGDTAKKGLLPNINPPAHYKWFGNTFQHVPLAKAIQPVYEGESYFSNNKLIILHNNTNYTREIQYSCVYLPEKIRFAVIYDQKWDLKQHEYQDISFEAAPVVVANITTNVTEMAIVINAPECHPVEDPDITVPSISAIAVTFFCLCLFTIERAGHRERLKKGLIKRRERKWFRRKGGKKDKNKSVLSTVGTDVTLG